MRGRLRGPAEDGKRLPIRTLPSVTDVVTVLPAIDDGAAASAGAARTLFSSGLSSSGLVSADVVSLGLALGVGLLVGFERERHPDTVAGVRTFGLAGLAGGLGALLTPIGATPWIVLAVAVTFGLAGVAGGIASGSRAGTRSEDPGREPFRDVGLTTAFALVATSLLGGYAVLGPHDVAVVAAGTLFLLLYIRDPLHALIRRLGGEDVRAIATFVLIALVILPVLPDRAMGPLDAVNPRSAWLLVVLVVSMSLSGYVAQSLLGARAGVLATGLLGGLVSSTATTASAARRVHDGGGVRASAAMALLACSVLPVRALVLVWVASREAALALAPHLGLVAAATVVGGVVAMRRGGGGVGSARAASEEAPPGGALPKPRNPTQLRSALAFAGAYVVIRIATKAAVEFLGTGAFLAVAAISGVTDMDAIAMSAARETLDGTLAVPLAAQGVLVALLVNTLFKLGVARALGGGALLRAMLPALMAAAALALVGVFLVGRA